LASILAGRGHDVVLACRDPVAVLSGPNFAEEIAEASRLHERRADRARRLA
jgi:hypothetical protein